MDKGLTVARPSASVAGHAGDFLPAHEGRIAMPEQVLWPAPPDSTGLPALVRVARIALLLLWAGGTTGFAWVLYRVLSVEEPTILQLVFLVLSSLCFAWVAVGSASAIIGFAGLAALGTTDSLDLPDEAGMPLGRTALLFPVYREDSSAVAG